MLYIVDGTGDADDEIYLTVMSGSFCDKMGKMFDGRYFRGPTRLDWTINTEDIAKKVCAEIRKNTQQLGKRPLFLAGHSRGGAAVIRVAQDLQKTGHSVDAMFLFDAVDRTGPFTRSLEFIPSNVRATYHAIRNTQIANYFEWGARSAKQKYTRCILMQPPRNGANRCEKEKEDMIKYRRLDDAMKFRMRASFEHTEHEGASIPFGNCGTAPQDKRATNFVMKDFLGSHGALGGSPIGFQDKAWLTDEDKARFITIAHSDLAAMASVWDWMCDFFDKEKVKLHNGVRSEARK